jgi:hypothetical protein
MIINPPSSPSRSRFGLRSPKSADEGGEARRGAEVKRNTKSKDKDP